jgi:hypothetical protein
VKRLILFCVVALSACATLQSYNALPERDKAFYNLLYVKQQNAAGFADLKSQQERDDFLGRLGYLQQYEALPQHVQNAIMENEIVEGAPEFTVYMAAGKPLKENRQVSMEGGDTRTLYYLRCAKDSGANADKFVSESGMCVARAAAILKSEFSPMPQGHQDRLLAEAINYMVTIRDGKVASVSIVTELPR